MIDLFEWARSKRRKRGPKKQSVRGRFERYYIPEPNSGCWLWMGYLYPTGYGNFNAIRGRAGYAHRVSYELYKGPIPAGFMIDHLCRNRACVNPDHLEIVTAVENQRRSPIANATKQRCPKGHEYDEKNTYVAFKNGKFRYRMCRACGREKSAIRRNRQRDLQNISLP